MKPSTIELILILVILFSCTSSIQLQGTWRMTPKLEENTEVIIQLNKETYTFNVNGKETVRIDYKLENNTIISEEKSITNNRDSIEVIQVTKNTLILNLKEKGQSQKRTFTRIE